MPVDYILPVSITFALVAWTFTMVWYIHPVLRQYPLDRALEPLLLIHCFRYIGLMFLVPGVTTEVLDPRFAQPAAYGDLLTAVLAFLAIAALRLKVRWAMGAVWAFNIIGFVDLINAVTRGIVFTPDGHLGATYWIPATIVPFLLVTHIYIFLRLLRIEGVEKRVVV